MNHVTKKKKKDLECKGLRLHFLFKAFYLGEVSTEVKVAETGTSQSCLFIVLLILIAQMFEKWFGSFRLLSTFSKRMGT